jgi:hypothetical protein
VDCKDFKKCISESEQLKSCLELLNTLGFVVWRSNAGGATYRHTYKTGYRKGLESEYRVRFGFKGMPDICGYIPSKKGSAIPFFWEVKRKGGQIRPDQRDFIEKAKMQGAFAGIGTVDDLEITLREKGYL